MRSNFTHRRGGYEFRERKHVTFVGDSFVDPKPLPSKATIRSKLRSVRVETVWEGLALALQTRPLDRDIERLVVSVLARRPFVPAISTVAAQVLANGSSQKSRRALTAAFADAMDAVPMVIGRLGSKSGVGGPVELSLATIAAEALYVRGLRRPAKVLARSLSKYPVAALACVLRIGALSQDLPPTIWPEESLRRLVTNPSRMSRGFALFLYARRGDPTALRVCRSLSRGTVASRLQCISILWRLPDIGEHARSRARMLTRFASGDRSLLVRLRALHELANSAPQAALLRTILSAKRNGNPARRLEAARLLRFLRKEERKDLSVRWLRSETDPVVRSAIESGKP